MVRRRRASAIVLVAASAIAVAVVWTLAAASGDWGGVTGQGRAFRFSINAAGDTIDQFRFNIATPCQSRIETAGPAQVVGDRIDYDSGPSSNCQVQISGTFTSPTTAAGTLTFTPHNRFVCACGGVEGDPTLFPPVTTNWSVNHGCSFTLSRPTFNADIPATAGSVDIVTAPSCRWTAISEASFVTISSGSSGTGSGTINFNVAANTDRPGFQTQPRTGTILIAGDPFTVSQPGCTFNITPKAATYGLSGGAGAVDVSAPGACSWDVTDQPAWASTTAGGTGAGDGTWQYSVAPSAGSARSRLFIVAGNVFKLTQLATPLKELTAGSQSSFTLADANGERWTALATVAGRSYCAELAPGPTALDAGAPFLTVYRADAYTLINNSSRITPRVCFVAPATETALFKVTQTDPSSRAYRLRTTETTLWANWFFTGTSYSSYTLLRNTTAYPIEARITWRAETGTVAAVTTAVVPSYGVVYVDARTIAPTPTGSVEIAHDGEPDALVASQTTLSAVTGVSFDAPARPRVPR